MVEMIITKADLKNNDYVRGIVHQIYLLSEKAVSRPDLDNLRLRLKMSVCVDIKKED